MFNGDLREFEGFTRNNGQRRAAVDLRNGEGSESDSIDETDEAASNHTGDIEFSRVCIIALRSKPEESSRLTRSVFVNCRILKENGSLAS